MGKKSTLLLLPGLLCDAANWASQCSALTGIADCQIPTYGHLNSIGAMADLVLSVAPERFALAGHSMGGRVALEVMRRAPERIERLALLDTGFQPLPAGSVGENERASRYALLAHARAKGMRAMGELWARGMVQPNRVSTPVFADILDMIDRSTPDLFESQINALLGRPDATTLLPTIRCPTMVLCGRHDAWSPLVRHEQMHDAIRHSTLVIVEDSGHMTTMEQPDAVSQALAEWLGSASAGRPDANGSS